MEDGNGALSNENNNGNFGNNENFKIIPKNFKANLNSPEEQMFAIIDRNGNVDLFIRCGDWGNPDDESNLKYTYYKFSFKVGQNIYNDDYDSVDKFVSTIQNEQINELTVSIIKPTADLNGSHDNTYIGKPIKNINIKIQDILNYMQDIGDEGWSTSMVNFLINLGQKEEAVKLFEQEQKFANISQTLIEVKAQQLLVKNIELQKKNSEILVKNIELQKKNIELLKNEKFVFKQKINPINNDDLAKLQDEKILLKYENEQLKNANDQLKKENVELQKNINPNQDNLINIKKEKDKLEKENQKLKKENEQYQNTQIQFNTAQEKLKQDQNELEIQKILLQNEKVKFEKSQEELEKGQNELKGLLEELQNENNRLKIDNGQLKIYNGLLQKSQENFENKKAKISNLFENGYSMRKGGLFGCCYRPYSSLDEIEQAEKEPAIVN